MGCLYFSKGNAQRGALASTLEVRREVLLGIAQNFDDCGAIGRLQPSVTLVRLGPRQDLPHPAVNSLLGGRRQGIECLCVDHVAAWVLEQPGLQVQRVQRAPLAVARTLRGKLFRKSRSSADWEPQRLLIDEEQVIDEVLRRLLHPRPAIVTRRGGRGARFPPES